jgi:hypothetical protein
MACIFACIDSKCGSGEMVRGHIVTRAATVSLVLLSPCLLAALMLFLSCQIAVQLQVLYESLASATSRRHIRCGTCLFMVPGIWYTALSKLQNSEAGLSYSPAARSIATVTTFISSSQGGSTMGSGLAWSYLARVLYVHSPVPVTSTPQARSCFTQGPPPDQHLAMRGLLLIHRGRLTRSSGP